MFLFKKVCLFLCILSTGFLNPLFGSSGSEDIIEADDSNFADVIEHGFCVVNFHADWSQPCQRFAKIFERISDDFGKQVKFITVNVDYSYYTVIKYNIEAVPTIILFKNGSEIKRNVGLMKIRELREFILSGMKKDIDSMYAEKAQSHL